MSEPIRSANRDFWISPARDRNREDDNSIDDGYYRISAPSVTVNRYTGGGNSPIPPGGFYQNWDPDREGQKYYLLSPSTSQMLAEHSALAQPNFITLGTPENFSALRPDLFLNGDGSYSWFRIRFRAWGIAPLCNPFFAHAVQTVNTDVLINDVVVSPGTSTLYRGNPMFVVRWNYLPEISDRRHGPLRVIPLNRTILTTDAEPSGIYRLDRIITAYGKYDPVPIVKDYSSNCQVYENNHTQFESTSPSSGQVTKRRTAQFARARHLTLENPDSPYIIQNTGNPFDDGRKYFPSNFTQFDIHTIPVMSYRVLDIAPVPEPFPMQYTSLIQTKLSDQGVTL